MSSPTDLLPRRESGRPNVSPLSRGALAAGVVFGAIAALVFAGFLNFVRLVPEGVQATPPPGDGIVALTGGAERLSDALRLLASGRGQRLLISGVHPETSERELSRAQPDYAAFARCCVDLGRRALNTAGNAVETRRWAESHGFRSLIVVTSGYHMPRTMMELAREMPTVQLIPYAVVTDRLKGEPWWRDWPTAKLLAIEYVKYVAAVVRVRLAPRLAKTETAEGRGTPPACCV
ncbi:YdcF family protein [Methylopila sp. M107]|uniref:YdcF family protein n=1 Tax=Methylopila sp. M107 TaxID=1101190 RepID=UPI0003760AE2|nr:YdcF family protein [Methylopila sp. M107]